jgi:hypothetical protein
MGKLKEQLAEIGKTIGNAISEMNNQEVQMMEPGINMLVGKTTSIPNVGEHDGIKVVANPENAMYLVETPNSNDIYWTIANKKEDKTTPFSNRLTPDMVKEKGLDTFIHIDDSGVASFKEKGKAYFEVPLDNLATDKDITDFNYRVNNARKANVERTNEINFFKFQNGKSGEPSEVLKRIAPENAFEPTKQISMKFGVPDKKFCAGEVLTAGKHYTIIHTGESSREVPGQGTVKTVHVHFLNTSQLLTGDDWKMSNREKAIQEKCPEGSLKRFNFDEKGKASVKDYDPQYRQKQEQAKEQVKEPVKAVEQPAVEQDEPAKEEKKAKTASKAKPKTKEKELVMAR